MSRQPSDNMVISVTVPKRVFDEISARASRQHVGKAAIARAILCDWFDGLSEGAKLLPSND